MLRLADIADLLVRYRGRFDRLDAFADDVEELRDHVLDKLNAAQESAPLFVLPDPVNSVRLVMQAFPDQGIVRFRLAEELDQTSKPDATGGVVLGGLLGAMLGAASDKKQGLLGGLVLGMLVGGVLGANSSSHVEKVMALRFDPVSSTWRIYDGPLLRWAKRALEPRAA